MNSIDCKKFNLNESVLVKLTKDGILIWRKDFYRYGVGNPEYPFEKMYTQKTNAEGYTDFQLWELMRVFGEHLKMGFNNQPFDPTILLPEQHLK